MLNYYISSFALKLYAIAKLFKTLRDKMNFLFQ